MKTKRITAIVLCMVLCVIMGGENLLSALFIPTSAANEVGSFDNTAIEDDLKNVDLKNYPQNSLGEVDIISLMEYGYSEQSYIDKYYGIYVYVYNPTGKPITLSGNNYVELGFYENGVMKPDSVNLQYLDRTSDNLIYKFKLDQSARILASARSYAAVNEGKRCYEISDIQFTANSLHANVSKKYVWSGYAAYCGPDSSPDSTLTCLDYGLKSIHLNLMHTCFREKWSANFDDYHDLNSVFFSVPESYFQDFGNLEKMDAQWHEYVTSSMYVTSDLDAYRELSMLTGKYINQYGQLTDSKGNVINKDVTTYWRIFTSESEVQFFLPGDIPTPVFASVYGSGFNVNCRDDIQSHSVNYNITEFTYDRGSYYALSSRFEPTTRIDWLFYTSDTITDNAYKISKDQVLDYMLSYTSQHPTETKVLGKYSSSLLSGRVDENRLKYLDANRVKDENGNYVVDENGSPVWKRNVTNGLVKMEFTDDIKYDPEVGNVIGKYEYVNWEEDFWGALFGGTEYVKENFAPIEMILEADLYLSAEEFAEKYYIAAEDAEKFQSEAKRSYASGERPFMLHFAVTNYSANEARFDLAEEDEFKMSDIDGYVASETVFLDFDVISLTFQDEENGYAETVIPVVAEPIDIINGLTPPDSLAWDEEERWQMLVALILFGIFLFAVYVLLGIYVPWLAKIIRWVAGAFWWLFTSLLKLLWWFISTLFNIITAPFRSFFDNASRKVKKTLHIRTRQRSRGRSGKSRSSRNSKFWQNTVNDLKSSLEKGKAALRAKAKRK